MIPARIWLGSRSSRSSRSASAHCKLGLRPLAMLALIAAAAGGRGQQKPPCAEGGGGISPILGSDSQVGRRGGPVAWAAIPAQVRILPVAAGARLRAGRRLPALRGLVSARAITPLAGVASRPP
jgi:hypothetical protein